MQHARIGNAWRTTYTERRRVGIGLIGHTPVKISAVTRELLL